MSHLLCLLLVVFTRCCLSLSSVAGQGNVQLSFCLIAGTSNVSGGAQSSVTFTTVSWGVFTTTSTVFSTVATYTVTSAVNGYQYTSMSSTLVPVSLLTGVGTDNTFSINSSQSVAAASVDTMGLGLSSAYGTVLLKVIVTSFYTSSGPQIAYSPPHGQLLVQLYNASAGYNGSAPPFPCQPTPVNATVQFSFCLITGPNPKYNISVDTWSTISYGIFTTTATLYTVPSAYFIGSIIDGYQYTNTNTTPVQLTSAPYMSPLPGPNDNALTITGSTFAPIAQTLTYHGLGLQSAYAAFTVATPLYYTNLPTPLSPNLIVYCNGNPGCGASAALTVKAYNASAGSVPLACEPPADQTTLLSFCLITSTSYSTSTLATFRTVSYGVFSAVTSPLTPGLYFVTSIINGSQYTNTNSTPSALLLLPVGPVQGLSLVPNNIIALYSQLGPALFTATTSSGVALSSAYTTFNFYSGDAVSCVGPSSLCGIYGQLTVQQFNASIGVTLPCSPSSPASSSSLPSPVSSVSSSVAIVPTANATLCVIFYGLPGNVDYPWSSATQLSLLYNPQPMTTSNGTVVSVLSGSGTRTYTNRFGVSLTTPLQVVFAGSLIYLNSSLPFDGKGLTWNLTVPIQLPGHGPSVLYNSINIHNSSGVLLEESSSRVDPLGQAYLSTIPGFVNVTIGASNINSLTPDYSACHAPISFTNGLRPPIQPSVSNGGTTIFYSYFITDSQTYSVQGNLTLTTSSAFATTRDQLGNPYQLIINIAGSRLYTHIPTGQTLMSTIIGLSTAANADQRFATQRHRTTPT